MPSQPPTDSAPPIEHGRLTAQRVARMPAPGTNVPAAVRFSPDGRLVSYLYSEDASLTRQLYALDVATGERRLLVRPAGGGVTDANVSLAEALRRERQRQHGQGVTAYAWAKQAGTLLVPLGGSLYVQPGDGELREVLHSERPVIDPQINPQGTAVVFVQDGELYSLDLEREGAEPLRLTFDASAVVDGEQVITNGLAEFVAQEEMGRASGFAWSLDGSTIAFEQVDLSPVERYTIVHQGEEERDLEVHRYPFAGGRNAGVRLGVVAATGGSITWLPLAGAGSDDGYLCRFEWDPEGRLLVQVMDRGQKRLELRRLDPHTAATETLLVETAVDWVNLHDDLRCLQPTGGGAYEILWSSERTGTRQLYLFDHNGSLLRQLTLGPWPVDALVSVDESRRELYFRGAESPLEAHLWRTGLDGGVPLRLTLEAGTHTAVFANDHDRFVDAFSSCTTQPRLVLRDRAGRSLHEIFIGNDPEPAALGLRPPELVEVTARDGTTLHGAIYRPSGPHPGWRFPVLVEVYGGPHVQTVADSWSMTVSPRAQFLAQQGFIVFKLDNRGSSRRGHTFEAPLFRRLGTIEVDDQVDGALFVQSLTEAEPGATGIYGWSYGGYMTLMCLEKAGDVFKAGVSGAPVTSWDGYDTFYTERYMETPQANPEGYAEGSALTHVEQLRAPLLLVHGMLDENVHFRHTARLINALNAALKPYELIVFPGERHGPRNEAQRAALETRLLDFFRRSLQSTD